MLYIFEFCSQGTVSPAFYITVQDGVRKVRRRMTDQQLLDLIKQGTMMRYQRVEIAPEHRIWTDRQLAHTFVDEFLGIGTSEPPRHCPKCKRGLLEVDHEYMQKHGYNIGSIPWQQWTFYCTNEDSCGEAGPWSYFQTEEAR
jgi:hypothetical protein